MTAQILLIVVVPQEIVLLAENTANMKEIIKNIHMKITIPLEKEMLLIQPVPVPGAQLKISMNAILQK